MDIQNLNIAASLLDLIGNTPLLYPTNYSKEHNIAGNLILKLEYFNPGGSVKDRVGKNLIEAGEKSGQIKKDTVIIEPTSGNTGIGLAMACAIKGYKLILTMPETMSRERRQLLSALGAEIVLTPGNLGMTGSVNKAQELALSFPSAFIPQQFENKANPEIHSLTTAREIWVDCRGRVDIFISAVGTGGTLTGAGEALRKLNPALKIIAVEPADSPLLSKGIAGPHKLQGMGANFIPPILNQNLYDEVIAVKTQEAMDTCRFLAKSEGLLVGISSGAAAYAGTLIGQRPENAGKNILVILPDSGERYLSTELFSSE